MTTPTTRHGAELVFVELGFDRAGLDHWVGRLVNPAAIDRETGKRARYLARIDELPSGAFRVTMQGHNHHARRYATNATLTEAQAQLAAWARRRFYVEA